MYKILYSNVCKNYISEGYKILYEYILLDENDNFISNITPDRFDIYDAVNNSNITGINKNRVYNENVKKVFLKNLQEDIWVSVHLHWTDLRR